MRVSIRDNGGFSLVELMVVVAIIGVLASIAIPAFDRFSAKSKQTEAKAVLSAIYMAEAAFQAEWQIYFTSFSVLGYTPDGGTFRYEHGFGSPSTTALPGNYTGPISAGDINTAAYCGDQSAPNPICKRILLPVPPGVIGPAKTSTSTTFLAAAKAFLVSDPSAPEDIWTMNQNKTLAVQSNGLP